MKRDLDQAGVDVLNDLIIEASMLLFEAVLRQVPESEKVHWRQAFEETQKLSVELMKLPNYSWKMVEQRLPNNLWVQVIARYRKRTDSPPGDSEPSIEIKKEYRSRLRKKLKGEKHN